MKKFNNGVRTLTNWEVLNKFERVTNELIDLWERSGHEEDTLLKLEGTYEFDTHKALVDKIIERAKCPDAVMTGLIIDYLGTAAYKRFNHTNTLSNELNRIKIKYTILYNMYFG